MDSTKRTVMIGRRMDETSASSSTASRTFEEEPADDDDDDADLEAPEDDYAADQSSLGSNTMDTSLFVEHLHPPVLGSSLPQRFHNVVAPAFPSLASLSSSTSNHDATNHNINHHDDDQQDEEGGEEEKQGFEDHNTSMSFRLDDWFRSLGRCVPMNFGAGSEQEIVFEPESPRRKGPSSTTMHTGSLTVEDNNDHSFHATFDDVPDATATSAVVTAQQQQQQEGIKPKKKMFKAQLPPPPPLFLQTRERSSGSRSMSGPKKGPRRTESAKQRAEKSDQRLLSNMSVTSSVQEFPDEDAPRPLGQSLKQRSRSKSTFFMVMLVACILGTISGISVAFVSRKNQANNNVVQQQNNEAGGGTTESTNAAQTTPPTPPNDVATPTFPTFAPATSPSPVEAPVASAAVLPTLWPATDDTPATSTPSVESLSSTTERPVVGYISTNATASTLPMVLPTYPSFRFIPWDDVPRNQQRVAANFLDYTEQSWNLPGTANNYGWNDVFWEGQSFTTIQLTARSLGIISSIAQLGFEAATWDCWINHYQNFTWEELTLVASIEIVFDFDNTTTSNNSTDTNRQGDGTGGEEDNSVQIGGRDILTAMATLGWKEDNWATSERFEYFFPRSGAANSGRRTWGELSAAERQAATKICYTRELWEGVPITEWIDRET